MLNMNVNMTRNNIGIADMATILKGIFDAAMRRIKATAHMTAPGIDCVGNTADIIMSRENSFALGSSL